MGDFKTNDNWKKWQDARSGILANKIKYNHNRLNHTVNLIACKNVDHSSISIVDSGTTGNYLPVTAPCLNKTSMQHPIQLHMPNGEIIKSPHKALLPMTQLPLKATEAIIFPKLRKALLSVSTLCNNGCTATFDSKGVDIVEDKGNKVLLKYIQKK